MNDPRAKRVLLVDDEADVRDILALMLESMGVYVVCAEGSSKALALYRADNFDLVVTDYNMPEMRGDELAAQIKLLAPLQRVYLMSGFAETTFQDSPFKSSVDGFLSKPCNLDQLIDALNGKTPHAPGLSRIAA